MKTWAIFLAACILSGCGAPRIREAQLPSAADLRFRHNARTSAIERLWARAVVEVRWTDERGKRRFEQGDGYLLFSKPDQVALSLGKLGEKWYWLGGDAQRFWWFDLNPQDDKLNTAYVGYHHDIDPQNPDPQLLVPPRQFIGLLGLTDLPESAQMRAGDARRIAGPDKLAVAFHVPADPAAGTLEQRIVLGTVSGRPLEIAYIDAGGATIASAKLGRYQSMQTVGPAVPTRIELTVPARKAELKISLEAMSGEADRFSDAQFDFESLARSLKPERIETIGPR